MADQPLSPATDRCLGRPLPHQLANQTRVHLKAIKSFLTVPCGTVGLCGISSRFQLLSPSLRQVTHALLTRSPLRLTSFFRRIIPPISVRLACVRRAASVRPEPGSNSLLNPFIYQLHLQLISLKFQTSCVLHYLCTRIFYCGFASTFSKKSLRFLHKLLFFFYCLIFKVLSAASLRQLFNYITDLDFVKYFFQIIFNLFSSFNRFRVGEIYITPFS